MSGIINAPAGDGGAAGASVPTSDQADASSDQGGGGLSNPLLRQVEQRIETNLAPDLREAYLRTVTAGLHIAKGFLARLDHSQDPVGDCGRNAAALALIERRESRGVLPLKAAIPAGLTLMLHGLDFIDRANIAKVAEPEVDRATTAFANFLFHKLGITGPMLQQYAGRVHQITQDPQQMAAINLKAGLTKHPMAATPTLPGMGMPGAGMPGAGMINGAGAAG